MEGDGRASFAPLPKVELPDEGSFQRVTSEEPVPNEPDPDVVLENLFRNSAGSRRKSSEKTGRSPDNLSEEYVHEISSDNSVADSTDGTVTSELPVPTPASHFEFVTFESRISSALNGRRVEPLEKDPLADEEPVPTEQTVLNMGDSLVTVPQDALAPEKPLCNEKNLSTEDQEQPTPDITLPGGGNLKVHGDLLRKTITSSKRRSPKTTNITVSRDIEPPSLQTTENFLNQLKFDDDEFIEVTNIKKEPPDVSKIDALQSALTSANIHLESGSEARPISLPGGTLVPIPKFTLLPGQNCRGKEKHDWPRMANNGLMNVDIPKSILPGSNVLVVMTPDGQLTTVPIQSQVSPLLQSSSSVMLSRQHKGPQKKPVKATLVQMPKRSAAGRGKRKMANTRSGANPKARNKSGASELPESSLSGAWSNPNTPNPMVSTADPVSHTWSKPTSLGNSDPLGEQDPLSGPVSHTNLLNSTEIHAVDLPAYQKPTASIPETIANGFDENLDAFLDKPSEKKSNSAKPQPLWPPPAYRKRKVMPKVPQKVAEIPLSGSWTNPSIQEKDPLEGPVLNIIPWDGGVSSNGCNSKPVVKDFQRPVWKNARSTQCNFFDPVGFLPVREAAGLEISELRRPLVSIRGYGLDIPAKQIIYNIYQYFEDRKKTFKLRYVPSEMTQIVSGIKASSVRSILREAKNCSNNGDPKKLPRFRGINRRRLRVKSIFSNLKIDIALREGMLDHFLKKKEPLGLSRLKKKCSSVFKSKTAKYGTNFVRLRMKTLGFVCVRTARRRIHVEGAAVRAWRYKYLAQMKAHAAGEKNIVFTLVLNFKEVPRTEGSEWVVMESHDEIKQECKVMTVCLAANRSGFPEKCFYAMEAKYNPVNVSEDPIYFEWLELQVLKKIPKDSVVVLAHQRFHDMEDREPKPSEGSSKQEIIDWLKSRVVGDVDETLPRCVLLDKVKGISVEQRYSIDSLVKTYGHTPVHLFPYQRDLNPLEYVWEEIRSNMETRGKLPFTKDTLGGHFSSVAPAFEAGWKRANAWVEYYIKKDPLIEVAQETVIRKLGGVWSSLVGGDLPDDGSWHNLDSGPASSDAESKKSEASSDSDSDSNSDSDSDSSESDSDSSSESDSDSNDSSTSESEDDTPLSERISNVSKKRKICETD